MEESKKLVKKAIYDARNLGTTVPFDLRTLVESGASLDTIRKVYRGKK